MSQRSHSDYHLVAFWFYFSPSSMHAADTLLYFIMDTYIRKMDFRRRTLQRVEFDHDEDHYTDVLFGHVDDEYLIRSISIHVQIISI